MYYSFDVINTSFFYEIIDGVLMFSVVLFGSCKREVEGLWPDKNWFMLSLKFPRQKIVKGDFLKRDGDFGACESDTCVCYPEYKKIYHLTAPDSMKRKAQHVIYVRLIGHN